MRVRKYSRHPNTRHGDNVGVGGAVLLASRVLLVLVCVCVCVSVSVCLSVCLSV